MRRRWTLLAPFSLAASVATLAVAGACRQAEKPAAPAKDLKAVAVNLQTKTAALVEALNARNEAAISRARDDLLKAADEAQEAVKSETGPLANQISAAVNFIRTAAALNNVPQLERAQALLQQAIAAA